MTDVPATDHTSGNGPPGAPEARREAVVVGAGPAGLAAAAMLRRAGIDALAVDQAERIGDSWRRHYDRLHLHTVRWLSGLPGLPIPREEGKWVARDGVARYLESYARHYRIPLKLGTAVERIDRVEEGWEVRTTSGSIGARSVVVATGFNRLPWLPDWPGRDSFPGPIVHSSQYRNPAPYRGKRVLVVGTGNSGAEIAVDLVEGGASEVLVAVRTPPNIMRRDLFGFPMQVVGLAMRRMPRRFVDAASVRVQRLAIGDLSPYGLPAPPRGVSTRVNEEAAVPILDIGLVSLVKRRRVRIVAAVERLEGGDVVLVDGTRIRPEAVIAATGFRRGLEPLVGHLSVLRPDGRPGVHGPVTHPRAPGLYFIGFSNPISGNLRELGIDARKIARAIRGADARLRRPTISRR